MKIKEFGILYLDDQKPNLSVFRAAFMQKYRVYTVQTAADAVRVLETESIQILITDQRMPEVSGIEFLKSIIPRFPEPVRIILTGYTDIEVVTKAVNECGIYRYLTKPWSKPELLLALENALETYRLRTVNRGLLEQLQEQNRLLEEKVRERTREVEHQKELIEIRNRREMMLLNIQMEEKREKLKELNKRAEKVYKILSEDVNREMREIKKISAKMTDENRDDWETFRQNFDYLHEDFLSRLKGKFPALTQNDLKMCAYLRVNLQTKEIADLMNIGVRGVETARYRLRKKLVPAAEIGLYDFLRVF